MEFPDLSELEWYYWLIIGGGAVAVLSLIGYFAINGGIVKVPAAVVGALASLALGVGVGVVLMVSIGYHWEEKPAQEKQAVRGAPMMGGGGGMMGGGRGMGGGGGGGMMGGGRGMGGGGGGMMGGGMGGGMMRQGPRAKTQLATLIGKLDQLTSKTLTLTATPEQKKVIAEETKGLLDLKELNDEDAKKRLDALLKAFEKNKETLRAAGYQWPGGGQRGGRQGRGEETKNPFKEEANEQHLKGLRAQVAPEKPSL